MLTSTPTLKRPARQALATLALVVFTVFPTIYVVMTSYHVNRPRHVREVAAALGRELGLNVSLEQVRHPRPGEDLLRGLVIQQPEPRGKSALELASARLVRVVRRPEALVLEVEGLRLRAESPRQALAQLGALLERIGQSQASYPRVSLTAPTCEIDMGGASLRYQFRDVAGDFESSATAPALTVSYRATEEGAATRCELSLTRDRRARPVRTAIVVKTMEGLPLPARVLEPFFETADWLGPSARMEGTLALSQQGQSDWEAQFEGTLTEVDLGALVGKRFPDHRLSGLAVVKIARARWADRPGGQGFGWVEAQGELRCGPGMIGTKLLQALKKEMQFRLPAGAETRGGDQAFQGMGLTFGLGANGELRLGGGLGTEFPPAAILIDADHFTPLASAPEGAANVRGLIRTLFPTTTADTSALVPDTAESRVIRFLPAPVTSGNGTRPTGN